MVVRIPAILAFCFCCSLSSAVEIPKTAIFGEHIKGTEPIEFLARGKRDEHGVHVMDEPSPVTEIGQSLSDRWVTKPEGMVLSGSAQHAIRTAKARLLDCDSPGLSDSGGPVFLRR